MNKSPSRSFTSLYGAIAISLCVLSTGTVFAFGGWDPDENTTTHDATSSSTARTIARLKARDPGLKRFFSKAYGYAVFPTVGKGGIGLGGAYGEGKVYRRGKYVGDTSLTQISFGFQLGGQAFTEIIFFKDKHTLNEFIKGNFELGAQASAIALKAGISADADYSNGVAIFTMPQKGLMYEAVIAGQKFSFEPG